MKNERQDGWWSVFGDGSIPAIRRCTETNGPLDVYLLRRCSVTSIVGNLAETAARSPACISYSHERWKGTQEWKEGAGDEGYYGLFHGIHVRKRTTNLRLFFHSNKANASPLLSPSRMRNSQVLVNLSRCSTDTRKGRFQFG